jgi:hypothetical protein
MVLNDLPRNVFTTCAKDREQVPVPKVEFKILGEGGQLLMVVENQVTFADVVKAAKCAKLKSVTIRKHGFSTYFKEKDFPVKCSLVIEYQYRRLKFDSIPESLAEYAMIRSSDELLIQVAIGGITKEMLDKAAICAGLGKNYTASKYKVGKPLTLNNNAVFKHDVFLRKKSTKHGDPVFHICESTSVAPIKKSKSSAKLPSVMRPPIVVESSKQSAKQKLINVAIEGLQHAITALKNLEKII